MNQLFVLKVYTSKFITGWLAWIGAAIGTIVGFVFGSQVLFYIFSGLILLDALTGISASLVKGEKVSSKRFQETIYKLLAYGSVLLVAACLSVVFPPLLWVHTAAIGWIIAGESVGVLENCEHILKRRIPFLSRLKKVLDVLKGNGAEKNE